MLIEHFIKKWLANPQKEYTEQFRDEMRDDLFKLIESKSTPTETKEERKLLISFIEHCNKHLCVEDMFAESWVDEFLESPQPEETKTISAKGIPVDLNKLDFKKLDVDEERNPAYEKHTPPSIRNMVEAIEQPNIEELRERHDEITNMIVDFYKSDDENVTNLSYQLIEWFLNNMPKQTPPTVYRVEGRVNKGNWYNTSPDGVLYDSPENAKKAMLNITSKNYHKDIEHRIVNALNGNEITKK